MKKRGKIRIELQSDLCISSGYSYAGIVDSDICYDDYGIPYIPARRLKGCFRETAESILYGILTKEDIDSIFGAGGAANTQGLMITNAYIEDYELLADELNVARGDMKDYVSTQSILEAFSHIQSQTKLENGVAVDNSLRYTRVVDAISPITMKPLVFYADVEFDVSEEHLRCIVKATRNIGLKRNRGNGLVRCELVDVQDNCSQIMDVSAKSDNRISIKYTISNQEPLMLSVQNDTVSEKYILGQSVLGLLANRYLSIQGNSAEDDTFRDLFLNGTTCYSNVYPSKNNKVYYPAPEYVNKLKKTKKVVNMLCDPQKEKCNTDETSFENGNQPKKLKGMFVMYDVDNNEVDIKEVSMKTVYHNNINNSKDEESGLYTQNVISEGQDFTGIIHTTERYADMIIELLTQSVLTFGKSKTAEYGYCLLKKLDKISDCRINKFSKGQKIVVTMLSDGIFWGKNDYSCECASVKECIAEQLGIRYRADNKDSYEIDMIQTGQITGYNSVWNLRKAPLPAIKAGSCFVYELTDDIEIDSRFVGEKNQEGYGEFCVHELITGQFLLKNIDDEKAVKNEKTEYKYIKGIITDTICNRIEECIVLHLIENYGKYIRINNTQLGRVTLMLKESVHAYPEDKNFTMIDFNKRVDSIESDKVRNEIKKIGDFTPLYDMFVQKNNIVEKEIKSMEKLGYSQEEIKKQIDDMWPQCIMKWLTYLKYTAE